MISEFRKTKLLFIFYTFFDTDSSGVIDKADFDLTLETISKARGWTPDDAKYKEAKSALEKIWEEIQKSADANNDGKISVDEWLAMWDDFAKDKAFEWQNLYCKFIFNVQDASGDGAVDIKEYAALLINFGHLQEDAVAAFEKMSQGKPTVTWTEFPELWKQYFASENPSDPGNFIFGAATF